MFKISTANILLLCLCLFGCHTTAPSKIVSAVPASSQEVASAPKYVPDGPDWAAIVGVPPASGSTELANDVASVDWCQRTRNPMTVNEAWAGVDVSVACFQSELNANVKHGSFPELYATVATVMAQCMTVAHEIKDQFKRPRPFLSHDELHPALPKPSSYSFPSGHATRGMLTYVLLADLFPENKEALEARGRQIGYLRVAAGMHYPTDVEAGQRLGLAVGEAVLTTTAWKQAREELAGSVAKIRASR
jgi:acid phosphatase (class A)